MPAGASGPEGLHGKDEWWVPDLPLELELSCDVRHRWLRSGWASRRQLPGARGRLALWAGRDERKRLRELPVYEISHRGEEGPVELTRADERQLILPSDDN